LNGKNQLSVGSVVIDAEHGLILATAIGWGLEPD
jgi:hypothetical protein